MFKVFILISYIIHLFLSFFFGIMNFKMYESTCNTIVNSMLLFIWEANLLINLLDFFPFKIKLYCVASAGDSLKGERYILNILKISSDSNW